MHCSSYSLCLSSTFQINLIIGRLGRFSLLPLRLRPPRLLTNVSHCTPSHERMPIIWPLPRSAARTADRGGLIQIEAIHRIADSFICTTIKCSQLKFSILQRTPCRCVIRSDAPSGHVIGYKEFRIQSDVANRNCQLIRRYPNIVLEVVQNII